MRVLDDGLGGLDSDQIGEVELWGFAYFRCNWSSGDFGSFGSCDLCFSCASCLYSLRYQSSVANFSIIYHLVHCELIKRSVNGQIFMDNEVLCPGNFNI